MHHRIRIDALRVDLVEPALRRRVPAFVLLAIHGQAIARRIAFYASLRLLSDAETQSYIEHRCTIAGASSCPFDASAVAAVFDISRGNLRCIDLLCLEALERAATARHDSVSSNHIVAARKVLWP